MIESIDEFIKASAMMCESYKTCSDCIFDSYRIPSGSYFHSTSCDESKLKYGKEYREIVEKWWDENRPLTNAEWVAKKAREMGYNADPEWIAEYRCPPAYSEHYSLRKKACDMDGCDKCKKWWNSLHKEVEDENTDKPED